MEPNVPRDPNVPPAVIIFGAGITGLTAAHELVERGWTVTVVEKEIDPLDIDECAIGGLAKTQWAVYQAKGAEGGTPRRPTDTRPLAPTVRLRLDSAPDQAKVSELTGSLEATPPEDLERTLKALFDAILDLGSQIYLARLAERLTAIRPFVPKLLISFGSLGWPVPAEYLAKYLRLVSGGADVEVMASPDFSLPGPVWQIETDLRDSNPLSKDPGDFSSILPGEHGFRFFPAFYRHIFDTLQRIPVRAPGESFGDVYRTVYDNLLPEQANWLAVVRGKGGRPKSDGEAAGSSNVIEFPRQLPTSLRAIFDAMNDLQSQLGYTARDVELLKLRLFKYMTSCAERRRKQYADMSWSDFMGLSDLSEICQQDMERAPQLLAAMTATQSDSRTQGNIATQLLLDPINNDDRVDSTLDAPTTVAWFGPWKDYLLSQGVRFIPASLTGFEARKGKLCPKVEPSFSGVDDADYYVLALPVQAWSAADYALIEQWKTARGELAKKDHMDRLQAWLKNHVVPGPDNSLGTLYKGLTGIQFYFDADEMTRSGTTLFMDSEWRLSAISPVSFWHRRRASFDGYRGLLSVDIGSLDDATEDPPNFWHTPRSEVHHRVWAQINDSYGAFSRVRAAEPPYRMYHIDEYIEYSPETHCPVRNRAPFLINGIREWDWRAGWFDPDNPDPKNPHGPYEPPSQPVEEPSVARYELMPRVGGEAGGKPRGTQNWVLAGTFMQTWTRATTMEAANESARHAVNTLLADASESETFKRQAELCPIWNPEEYEHPDLLVWRELDERLFGDGTKEPLPHMFDILELDAVPDLLLAMDKKGDFARAIHDLVNAAERSGADR